MGKKKVQLASLLFIVSLSLLVSACSNSKKDVSNISSEDKKNLKVIQMDGTFAVDVDDPKETVGDADYVFIGRVDEDVDTVYKNPVTIETRDGTKEVSTPYTNYKVTVLQNIKGDLVTDTSIPIRKAGGINEDGSSVVLYEDDALPEEGKSYVFLAYAQDDESLLVSGPNSNEYVEGIKQDVTSEKMEKGTASLNKEAVEVVSEYENAFENEIPTERNRSESEFDADQ
ncbi:cell surface protein [Peribacillus muralis]|uniref:cell surface protein n=1 Tax=Peribacillus muralis TaxID=264697 RepID=UPI001F4D3D48|nr:cell surface protein [Peribacillus muralis]MCK1992179.1 cell surface protein [Peribacillus muralis]MCK2012735.1 cell surface protein [Peribacillus muralis]